MWLVLVLPVIRVAPMALVLVLLNGHGPHAYRVAGMLLALPAAALVVHTVAAARQHAVALAPSLDTPDEDYLHAVAAAARSRGLPVPTVLWPEKKHDDGGLPAREPHPIAIRGWRWCFVFAPRNVGPDHLVESVADDLRDGTARLRPLLWAVRQAADDWPRALRMTSTTVRPRVSADLRIYTAPLLLLAPLVAVGYLVSGALMFVTRLLLPRRLDPPSHPVPTSRAFDQAPVLPDADQAADPLPQPPRPVEDGSLPALHAPTGRIIVALLVTVLGTYQGLGALPGERVVWPWEQGPRSVEVVDVEHTPRADGLLGHVGLRHNSTWRPTVALGDHTQARLAEGTTEVRVGERIPVVAWQDEGIQFHRHLHQTSPMRYAVMSVIMIAIAFGLSAAFNGRAPLAGAVGQALLRQVDHDQRVHTGRRHRRRRPWNRIEGFLTSHLDLGTGT